MIEGIDLACRVLLITVYMISSITKLKDIGGTRQAIKNFGINNDRLVSLCTFLLPITELIIIFLLFSNQTSVWGGIISTVLLLLFIALIINLIQNNKSIHCYCFGQTEMASTSWHTVVRNVGLLILSFITVIRGDNASSFLVVLNWHNENWIMFLFVFLFMFQIGIIFWLMDRSTSFKNRIEILESEFFQGLPLGTKAPDFELKDFKGHIIRLSDLLMYKKPLLLLFFDPECGPCQALLPKAIEWHNNYASFFRIVFIARAGEKNNILESVENIILLNPDNTDLAQKVYKTRGFPSAIALSSKGVINNLSRSGELGITKLVSTLSNQ